MFRVTVDFPQETGSPAVTKICALSAPHSGRRPPADPVARPHCRPNLPKRMPQWHPGPKTEPPALRDLGPSPRFHETSDPARHPLAKRIEEFSFNSYSLIEICRETTCKSTTLSMLNQKVIQRPFCAVVPGRRGGEARVFAARFCTGSNVARQGQSAQFQPGFRPTIVPDTEQAIRPTVAACATDGPILRDRQQSDRRTSGQPRIQRPSRGQGALFVAIRETYDVRKSGQFRQDCGADASLPGRS